MSTRSKKGGLVARRRSALARLEATYNAFVKEGKDKKSWTTNGGVREHLGGSYASECKRLQNEINVLKSRIH